MRLRHWREVRAALLHLGVEIAAEHDLRIVFCRGAVVIATLAKERLVPVLVQRQILNKLQLNEREYLAALAHIAGRH